MHPAILFDMDGLLIDSERTWQKVEHELLAEHGRTFRPEIARLHMGMRIDEASAVMLREYGIEGGDPLEWAGWLVDALLAEFERELVPMPGALALMDEAAAWPGPVAIASSSPLRVVRHVVAHFGWQGTVDALCAGDEVERGKPAPDIFLLAAARLGVEPAHCLVLEDSVNGARAARAAGMRCIAVPNEAYSAADFAGIADTVLPTLEGASLRALAHSHTA